jgi:hypothetical protein
VSARRLAALALIAIAVQAPSIAAACPAEPTPDFIPCELGVVGGEDAWRADNVFSLRWSNPPPDGELSVAAVHYRLLDPSQEVVLEKRIGWAAESIDRLAVPLSPGTYTAEVWLENDKGALGKAASAQLRFDNARPGRVDPLPTPSWIGRAQFPLALRLGHPDAPLPLSGIRGYAVSVDRNADGDPCAEADRCTDTETDLHGGVEEDTLTLAQPPEGTSHVHAVAVSGSGMKSSSVGNTILRVDATDPVTTLSGVPADWTNHPVTLTASAIDAASGMAPVPGLSDPFTAIRVDGGAPVLASGDSVRATLFEPGIHSVAYYARDAAGNVNDGGSANGHPNAIPASATVRIDTEPPHLAFSNVQNPLDPETIEVEFSDSLSGVDSSRGLIAVRPADSGERFEALPTQVDGSDLRARWDSDAYTPGLYEFRAIGFDLAGNAGATTQRANGSRMVLSAPLKTRTSLDIRLPVNAGRGALRLGRGTLLSGRLIGGRRAPLARMPVQIVERFGPGSTVSERVSTVRTDSRGGFLLHLRPGPSRSIVAAFAGTATRGRSQSTALRLAVRGGVRMRASSAVARVGGRPIVFSGAVLGGNVPPDGKLVQLQFRLPGVPWTEFRTIRTDRRGRFRYAYAFSDDDSRGVRFRFRAYAPAQDDWPYEAAASRPVVVRGL